MPTKYTSSQDCKLKMDVATVSTEIKGIKGFTGPAQQTDYADITNLASANKRKEKAPILIDSGTVSFDLIYDGTDPAHQALRTRNADLSLGEFDIEDGGTTGEKAAFSAYVSKFEFKRETGQVKMVAVELNISGNVTFTNATA